MDLRHRVIDPMDLTLAVRSIRKLPGLSAVIIGSIAIGIGVNTTVFSWIQARVLSPIAGVERGRDFALIETRGETGSYPGLSWLEYRDLTGRLPSFREVIAFRMAPLSIGAADWSERTYGVLVSGNYFTALGVRAAAGRLLAPEDTAQPGGPSVVIVSHRFWQSRLAGAQDVIGRSLRVNDRPFTIVGVAPRGFVGTVMGLAFDVWVPATAVPLLVDGSRELESRGQRGYMALGDLKPGASRADGQRDLDAAMRELAQAYPDTNATIRAEILSQWQSPRGPQQSLMGALVMLQAVMLLVLVVVAGNTTNLVLARASSRRQDVGAMLAIGASRWRIIRLVLTENLLLALFGAGLGALIAVWGTTALRAVPLPSPGGLELSFDTRVDLVSLAFALVLGALSGLIIGLPPALHLAHTHPHAAMKSAGVAPGRSAVRDVFLALEVALAIVVLVVAAMFLKRFNDTRTADPGFRREGVLLATYDLRGRSRGVAPAASGQFAARLLDRVRALPAVESASLATSVPLDIHGMPSRMFSVEGHARSDGSLDQALTNTVSPGYFETMGIQIVQGTDFADLRDPAAPLQAIVNEEFVRRYVANGEAVGRRVDTAGGTYVIAGVVRNSLYNGFGEAPSPFIYLSFRDRPSPLGEIHVRTRPGFETAITAGLRAIVRDLDQTLPIYNVRTLASHVDANLVFRRIPARMFAVLGPLLLVLVAIGIWAVVAYSVARRQKEIGTRLALGATGGRVVTGLVGDTLRVVALGMAGGGVVALMVNPGVLDNPAAELPLLAGVVVLFLAAAVLACWLPARRASLIDPIVVLKHD
jgi:predicted permease